MIGLFILLGGQETIATILFPYINYLLNTKQNAQDSFIDYLYHYIQYNMN